MILIVVERTQNYTCRLHIKKFHILYTYQLILQHMSFQNSSAFFSVNNTDKCNAKILKCHISYQFLIYSYFVLLIIITK